ncbi:hypothetical protein F5148DRAFT_1374945 [Russula earlei]|uniref:Uncharacterized protein n=1 Tax=Russula earlei TaxID=71964 RepID=A0ACC0UFU1_9AGAM|nr:hypothetical protein F5148DRAFT_1374945 [Russula earlei]
MPEVTNNKPHIVVFGLSVTTCPHYSLASSWSLLPLRRQLPYVRLVVPPKPSTIDTLPDDALVEIFHFYVNDWNIETNGWHTLVHVCQRWRCIVFATPRRLNLRLEYLGKRPMSEILDVWPVLPVVLNPYEHMKPYLDLWGNVAGALESEHYHRICRIQLFGIPTSHLEMLTAAMQKPFPELTSLHFWAEKNTVTSLPDSFLGRSAPLLRHLSLCNCPLPGMPKLLLSSNQLESLCLWNIPDADLNPFASDFDPFYIRQADPPSPLTRSVLPALTSFVFCGVHEYLEALLARIEAPLLTTLYVTFFMALDFVLPQLYQLIGHTKSFKTCDRAFVHIRDRGIQFEISGQTNPNPELSLHIRCKESDWQLSSLAQVCSSSLPLLSPLVRLDIPNFVPSNPQLHSNPQWLELLASFTAVKDLRLSDQVAPYVCPALEELAEERVTDVLPALQNIFLRSLDPLESVPKRIEGFIAARKLSGCPVAIHHWE